MFEHEENSIELTMPKKISVYVDKKTQAKSVALPFKFLDGTNGVVVVTRLHKEEWNAPKEIDKIKITFT